MPASGTMRSALTFGVGMALGIVAVVAALLFETGLRGTPAASMTGGQPAWTEIKWPFAVDLWSAGRAFRCNPAVCLGEVTLFVRAKIGFCNCTMGVADDAELERLADLDLFGGRHAADGPGRPIAVASMKGRSRSYTIASASPHGKSALAIAFNERCDAIVATAIVGHDRPEMAEPAVLDFLNGDAIQKWARVTLGL
jgi:hypothetical protein